MASLRLRTSEYERSRTPSPPSRSPKLSAAEAEAFPSAPSSDDGLDGSPIVGVGGGWEQRLASTMQPALRVHCESSAQPTPFGSPLLASSLQPSAAVVPSQTPSPPQQRTPAVQARSSLTLPPSLQDMAAPETAPRPERLGGSAASSKSAATPRTRTVLLSWGQNSCGQLGFGDFTPRIFPRAVEYFRSARLTKVVCGSRSTLALDADGKVFAWGKGEDGTLGLGDRSTVLTPRLVEAVLRQPIAEMTCRGAHVLALTEKGQLWAWGRNEDGQLGTRRTVQAPREHTHHATPERVAALMGVAVRHVACGRCHSLALDEGGRLYSWGGNDDGALGHGDTLSRPSPTVVRAFATQTVLALACGSRHTLALVRDATVRPSELSTPSPLPPPPPRPLAGVALPPCSRARRTSPCVLL